MKNNFEETNITPDEERVESSQREMGSEEREQHETGMGDYLEALQADIDEKEEELGQLLSDGIESDKAQELRDTISCLKDEILGLTGYVEFMEDEGSTVFTDKPETT